MTINLAGEHLLGLSAAAQAVPMIDNKRPHCSTIFRWIRIGIRGVRLEHVRIGRRLCTSREALGRFAQALADAELAPAAASPIRRRTDRQRRKAVEAAEERLAADGI